MIAISKPLVCYDLDKGQELLNPAHPDLGNLEALRWAGDPPVWVAGTMPEPEIAALPWECLYCGSTNPGEALYCGQFGPSHCGAPNPRCNEPPRGVLHLREPELKQFGSFYVVKEIDHLVPEMRFYPEQSMTVTHPGKTAREHKREIGTRLLSAFQKVIRGAMSLC